VKRAIATHRRDFVAILALLLGAIFVTGYILTHEPAFTFAHDYYTVNAQFSNAAAVTSGQGQTVDIAGVEVGQVGSIKVEGGHAVVQMNIFKKYAPIYRNATVLLRPRTPLKDMYLELDPGTPGAGAIPGGGTLPVGATNPTVDFSEILSSLDQDTRDYLLLLLADGARAFRDPGNNGERPSPAAVADLRGVFKRFAPLNRDTRTFTRLLALRQQNIRAAIHGLEQVTTSLGSVQGQLTSLINSANTNFHAIASQASQVQSALTLLPATLRQSAVTFNKLRGFGQASTSSASRLLPWAHALAPALIAVRPLFRQTTPVIRDQLRPFSVALQPVARILKPAAAALAAATPPLARSFKVLNALFNTLAYQPKGGEQGYLFWGSWLSHIAASLTSQQDAQGPVLRGTFMGECSELQLFEVSLAKSVPSIANLLALLNAPDWSTLPGVKNGSCPF
jgi:phospholipid/cholesterol/gamma-HCH transport system substrate-binding protein